MVGVDITAHAPEVGFCGGAVTMMTHGRQGHPRLTSSTLLGDMFLSTPHSYVSDSLECRAQANAASVQKQLIKELPSGVEIFGKMKPEYNTILTKDALEFVAKLARKYTDRWAG